MAEKRKGYGKLAKRRLKMLGRVQQYKDDGDDSTADRYTELSAQIETRLREAGVCILCGRPLKNKESLLTGLGPECTTKLEEEEAK